MKSGVGPLASPIKTIFFWFKYRIQVYIIFYNKLIKWMDTVIVFFFYDKIFYHFKTEL